MCLAVPAYSVTPVGILPAEERGGEWDAFAVVGIPDCDGDDAGDFLVGDTAWNDRAGRVLLYSGATLERLRTFESPTSLTTAYFGIRVAVTDLDGDATTELIVTAYREGDSRAGRVHIFSFESGAHLRTIDSPQGTPGGCFGNALDILDDVDGDGIRDLLVGASHETSGTLYAVGRVYVISGAEQATVIHTLASPHPVREGHFGGAVAAAPDLDDDGIADFAVGAPGETSLRGETKSGRVYLFSGATGALIREITQYDTARDQQFGASLDIVGPDADGRYRLVVGIPLYYAFLGGALVFDPRTGNTMPGLEYGGRPNFGYVNGLGDVTADGIDDFGVGEVGVETQGRLFLYNGQVQQYWVSLPYGGGGYSYYAYPVMYKLTPPATEAGRLFGLFFSSVPDLNGDGSPDLLASGDGQVWLYRSEAHVRATNPVSFRTVFPRIQTNTKSVWVYHDVVNGLLGILRFVAPGYEITGPDAEAFQFESPPSTEPLPFSYHHDVRIRFAPQTSGQKTATLKIYTNDPNDPVFSVALSGLAASIQVSTTTLQFEPRSPFQEPSPPQTFTITNHGDTSLGFVYPCMEITGEEATEFFLDPEPNFYPILARQSRTFSVRFRPMANGPRKARLNIYTTDPFQPGPTIDLTGAGLYIPDRAIYVPSFGTLLVVDPRTGNRGIATRSDWGLGLSLIAIHGVHVLDRDRLTVGGMTGPSHPKVGGGYNHLLHVEKKTGNRFFPDEGEHWSDKNLYPPIFDRESSGTLVVLRQDGVQRVDPETGVGYTLIPDEALGIPFPNAWPNTYTALAAEPQGTILLAGHGVRRFDPETILAQDLCTSPIFSIDIEPDGSIVAPVVTDDDIGCVVRINPQTGKVTLVSGAGIGTGPSLIDPFAIAVDPKDGSLLVMDTGLVSLLRINPETGDRTLVSGPGRGIGPPLRDTSDWPDYNRQLAVEPDWPFPLWGARYWILR